MEVKVQAEEDQKFQHLEDITRVKNEIEEQNDYISVMSGRLNEIIETHKKYFFEPEISICSFFCLEVKNLISKF